MKKIIGGWLPVLFAAVMLISACSPDKKPPAARPAPVDVAVAANKAVPVRLHALGAVEAYQTISVMSQVTAQIRKVLFKEGQDVKAGDLLIELDCRTYEAELQKAEADLARDRAQAKFAGIQSRRYSDLVKKDYVAREQYDQLQANHEALEATVKADEAFVESSRVQIRYCSIYSPVDGRAGMQKVSSGNIVRANDTEILTIHQIQPVKVSFAIPENDLPEVRKYFPGKKIEADALLPGEERPEKGELFSVDNAVSRTTGTIMLKAVFANPDKRLVPGQFVDVELTLTTEPDVLLVPSRSVEQGQGGRYVFVVGPDLTAEMRPVVTGREVGEETVILKGLKPGEQVVVNGQLRLTPGAKVVVKGKE